MKILTLISASLAVVRLLSYDVTIPAGDGANEITMEIDNRGFISAISSTAVHVAQNVEEPITNVLADVDDIELTAKYAAIRRARDLYEREYVVIEKSEWCELTNTVERLRAIAERRWNIEHATPQGRMAWHGKPVRRMSADGTAVLWEYPDGYKYEQKVTPSRPAPRQITKNAQRSTPNPNQYKHLPPRLRAKRQAQDAQGKATEVNATFGPGGKVINAEVAK